MCKSVSGCTWQSSVPIILCSTNIKAKLWSVFSADVSRLLADEQMPAKQQEDVQANLTEYDWFNSENKQ